MNFIIREPISNDLDSNLLNLFIQGYEYHYNNRPDKFKNRSKERLSDILVETMRNSKILVIEKEKIIIGYVSYQFKEKVHKSLWIDELVIDTEYRNSGYGKILMNKLEDIAKEENCKNIELCCWEFNNNAKAIYEHLEYKEQRIIYEKNI
ncbi:MAG: GNAT family N-acetyltransferase [Clostridia bacterium]